MPSVFWGPGRNIGLRITSLEEQLASQVEEREKRELII